MFFCNFSFRSSYLYLKTHFLISRFQCPNQWSGCRAWHIQSQTRHVSRSGHRWSICTSEPHDSRTKWLFRGKKVYN